MTAENSVIYKDGVGYVAGGGKNEPSTIKRRPNKITGSLSRTGSAGEQEEDEDEEDVGEIGTHRKESN